MQQNLTKLPKRQASLYIVAKHFGWTTDQICRNMTVVSDDIAKIVNFSE